MIGQLERPLEELFPLPQDKADGRTLLYSLQDICAIYSGTLHGGTEAEIRALLQGYVAKGRVGVVKRRRKGGEEGGEEEEELASGLKDGFEAANGPENGSEPVAAKEELYYYCCRVATPASPARGLRGIPLAKRARRGPAVAGVMALRASLGEAHDRLRKLKLLAKSRREHGDLEEMVQKWRGVAQEVLEEVRCRMRERQGGERIRTRQILQSLGVDWQQVGLEVSSSEEEAEEEEEEEEGDHEDDARGKEFSGSCTERNDNDFTSATRLY